MESSSLMRSTALRQPFLTRVVPLMLMSLGLLHLVDWAYVGFTDQWKLINGVGLLLLGGANVLANWLGVASTPGRPRTSLLAIGVLGFGLAVSAMVHSWL